MEKHMKNMEQWCISKNKRQNIKIANNYKK